MFTTAHIFRQSLQETFILLTLLFHMKSESFVKNEIKELREKFKLNSLPNPDQSLRIVGVMSDCPFQKVTPVSKIRK